MKKRLILKVLGLLLLLPMFSGCNDTDDVAGIFTGKTWKLTYITKANGHGWYKFADVDDSNIMEYADGKKTFMLVFSGTVEDDIYKAHLRAAAQSTPTEPGVRTAKTRNSG